MADVSERINRPQPMERHAGVHSTTPRRGHTRNPLGLVGGLLPGATPTAELRPPVLDGFSYTAQGDLDPLAHVAPVGTIRPQRLQASPLAVQWDQQPRRLVTARDTGGLHHRADDQAQAYPLAHDACGRGRSSPHHSRVGH
jgi:hypothetical protein